jgi:hypothetical protein
VRFAPHPLLWGQLALLALGVAAAVTAPSRAPVFALYWEPIYRAEVGMVTVAIGYGVAVLLRLGYEGRLIRRIELPGGAALETEAGLEDAAAGFVDFRTHATARLDDHDVAIEDLDRRLSALEGGERPGGGA